MFIQKQNSMTEILDLLNALVTNAYFNRSISS